MVKITLSPRRDKYFDGRTISNLIAELDILLGIYDNLLFTVNRDDFGGTVWVT